MVSIHLIFKEDSELSSFLFGFRGIIGSGSDFMSLKEWIQESNNIVFFGGAGVSTESIKRSILILLKLCCHIVFI